MSVQSSFERVFLRIMHQCERYRHVPYCKSRKTEEEIYNVCFGLKQRIRTTLHRGHSENCMIVIKGDLSRGAEVIHSEVTIIS